jgi:hypothetical protein
MLIARKPYSGKTRSIGLDNYHCIPADLEALRSPLKQPLTSDEAYPIPAQNLEGKPGIFRKYARKIGYRLINL